MAEYCNTKHASSSSTIIFTFTFFCLQFVSLFAAYEPIDNIALDCGSSDKSTENGGTRTWAGDVNSKFFPSDLHRNSDSVTLSPDKQFTLLLDVPYTTARLSRSEFTYAFPVSPGQKFVRLYFYSAPYPNFDRSRAVFSVTAGLYTLLRDFNVSVNADASRNDKVFREYCVYVDENHNILNLTFTPTDQNSYAFISGIEIVSTPTDLYYTPSDPNLGLHQVGQDDKFYTFENSTSLEMVYRMNIGGRAIGPKEDTGMFRTWSEESNLLDNYYFDSPPTNLSIPIVYSNISPYTAPETLYRTARTMGPNNNTLNKSFNLTWEYLVDPGFVYMLRLHFCEIESRINNPGDRVFLIYIQEMIAESSADVIFWAGGKGIPIRRDYVVLVHSSNGEKRVNLSVKLQANPNDNNTKFNNVILNGIEIFKLSDTNGSLAGPNPDPPPNTPVESLPTSSISKNSKSKMVAIIVPIVAILALFVLGLFVFRRRRTFTDQTSNDGTTWWAPYSISTNKSSKTRSSNLPSNLSRYFSLAEIRAATKDFDDIFIIGIGGFGNVYKGNIDDGATQVAIKRLKPGSKQGAHEFKTEIEMLSQLRHLHLVSLIGYCNDGNEMILVYDYMSHGTLRSHLYGSDDEQPLTWQQRLQICIGAARGLHYLHTGAKHTIIHRDVKTTNILLDDKWVAKVSDFGLSKVGPTSMSKAHVSTVVKGSFGYLDPEYYRRQQLTEKSDVYSFGVVLCEVLCGRPALMRTADKKQAYLADWARRCHRDNTVAQIIDPKIKDEISPECLRKFMEMAVSCIQDDGIKRPAMNDVVWGLEFALQLQEATKKKKGGDDGGGGGEERWLMEEMFSSTVDEKLGSSALGVSSDVTTSNGDGSSVAYSKGMSGTVFSEIKDPTAR